MNTNARANDAHAAAIDSEFDRLLGDVPADRDHPIGGAQIRRHAGFDRRRVVFAEQAVGGDDQRQPPAFELLDHPYVAAAFERMLDMNEVGPHIVQEVAVPQRVQEHFAT